MALNLYSSSSRDFFPQILYLLCAQLINSQSWRVASSDACLHSDPKCVKMGVGHALLELNLHNSDFQSKPPQSLLLHGSLLL